MGTAPLPAWLCGWAAERANEMRAGECSVLQNTGSWRGIFQLPDITFDHVSVLSISPARPNSSKHVDGRSSVGGQSSENLFRFEVRVDNLLDGSNI